MAYLQTQNWLALYSLKLGTCSIKWLSFFTQWLTSRLKKGSSLHLYSNAFQWIRTRALFWSIQYFTFDFGHRNAMCYSFSTKIFGKTSFGESDVNYMWIRISVKSVYDQICYHGKIFQRCLMQKSLNSNLNCELAMIFQHFSEALGSIGCLGVKNNIKQKVFELTFVGKVHTVHLRSGDFYEKIKISKYVFPGWPSQSSRHVFTDRGSKIKFSLPTLSSWFPKRISPHSSKPWEEKDLAEIPFWGSRPDLEGPRV